MDLKQLKARGGLVMDPPVKRDIEWTHVLDDGDEVTDRFSVWVRRLPYGDVERMIRAAQNDGSISVEMISLGIRLGDKGQEAISQDEAYLLDPSLARLFAEVVEEVNVRKKKTSTPQTTSGTSSLPEASEAEQSPKPSTE
jgi:hypothetical protein